MEGRGQDRRPTASTNNNTVLRSEKLKEIDVLFRNQIREIYADSNANTYESKKQPQQDRRNDKEKPKVTTNVPSNITNTPSPGPSAALMSSKSTSTIHAGDISNSKIFQLGQEKVRASMMLRGEPGRAVESLRRDNQMKELRIRELSSKCEALLMKLQSHISPGQFEQTVEELRHCDDGKMQRLQNLVRIKKEEIFFKVRLQAMALLQEFGVSKEQVAELGAANGQDDLFSIMARLLKLRLRDFRNKEQQSSFQLQKDRILTQKQEERIHYLVETNELLRLSESKLKAKAEDLKNQLNEFLEKLKEKQHQSEQLQSQLFQMRRQNEELSSNNARLTAAVKACNNELADERRTWEAREKELKQLLNNYCLDKQRLEAAIEESNAASDELVIKLKFQKQENERLGRQLIRWKQRHQGLERQQGRRTKELQQELVNMEAAFEQYKVQHNQGILISHRAEVEQALRRVEEYQRAYEAVQLELEDERRLLSRAQEQHEERVTQLESEWMQRVKVLQKLRDEELQEIQADQEARLTEIREQMEKKEALRAQEMQAHMRALLAQKDKKNTEQLVAYQCENDQLKREIESLKDLLRAKQDFINAIKHHSK